MLTTDKTASADGWTSKELERGWYDISILDSGGVGQELDAESEGGQPGSQCLSTTTRWEAAGRSIVSSQIARKVGPHSLLRRTTAAARQDGR